MLPISPSGLTRCRLSVQINVVLSHATLLENSCPYVDQATKEPGYVVSGKMYRPSKAKERERDAHEKRTHTVVETQ